MANVPENRMLLEIWELSGGRMCPEYLWRRLESFCLPLILRPLLAIAGGGGRPAGREGRI